MNGKDKLTIVWWGEDWAALYVNGNLLMENHRLDASPLLQVLGFDLETLDFQTDNEEILWNGPPKNLNDIPWNKSAKTPAT